MKKIIAITLLAFIGIFNCNAQLSTSKESIISQLGDTYTSDITEDKSMNFIVYEIPRKSDNGDYVVFMTFFFKKNKDGAERCVIYSMYYPLIELQNVIKEYDSKVKKIKYGHWINQKSGYVFRLKVNGDIGFFIEVTLK